LIRNLFVHIIGVFLAVVVIKAGLSTLPLTTGSKLGDETIVSIGGAILFITMRA
jgi:hypothetical protein